MKIITKTRILFIFRLFSHTALFGPNRKGKERTRKCFQFFTVAIFSRLFFRSLSPFYCACHNGNTCESFIKRIFVALFLKFHQNKAHVDSCLHFQTEKISARVKIFPLSNENERNQQTHKMSLNWILLFIYKTKENT